jgi:hypothetical protein
MRNPTTGADQRRNCSGSALCNHFQQRNPCLDCESSNYDSAFHLRSRRHPRRRRIETQHRHPPARKAACTWSAQKGIGCLSFGIALIPFSHVPCASSYSFVAHDVKLQRKVGSIFGIIKLREAEDYLFKDVRGLSVRTAPHLVEPLLLIRHPDEQPYPVRLRETPPFDFLTPPD